MDSDDRVRVLVVDDHPLVRQGTRDILEREPGIAVVGGAATGEEAVALAEVLRPDVVMMDLGLPGMSGLEATRAIRQAHPEIKVLVLTIHDEEEYVLELLDAGAAGYLLKDVRDAELTAAVVTVAAGEAVLHPKATAVVLARLRARGNRAPDAACLSDRETAILQLVADGLENRQIGERLLLSPRTVEVHLHNAFRKLGAHSRTEAAVTAIRLGIVRVEAM